MKIGQRLQYVRNQLGLTQKEVVEKLKKGKIFCQIDTSSFSRYENEQRSHDLSFIEAFCELFNVNSDWLICGKGGVFRVSPAEKSVETVFLELSGLIQDAILPQPELPDFLPLDFAQMSENTPEKFILLLAYMLKDASIRRHVFMNLYFFTKSRPG